MAVEGEGQLEMKAHERDYSKFVAMLKWGTIISAIVAFLVVIIISA